MQQKTTARVQNILFIILLMTVIVLLGWVSQRYYTEFDLTSGNRNTLTDVSVNALGKLTQILKLTAFVRTHDKQTHDSIKQLVGRYQRYSDNIELEFLDPDLVPQLVREKGITREGEVLARYGNREESVSALSEKQLTRLLVRFSTGTDQYIAMLEGHGERDLLGKANHDLGEFGKRLQVSGFMLQPVNLARSLAIPENTKVLVIASPRTALLPGEITLIQDYLDKGGSLLWLTDPDNLNNRTVLANMLGIKVLPGIVVDATTRLFGISDPTFALVIDYPRHMITENLHSQTLFPKAVGLEATQKSDWMISPLLNTLDRSWTETSGIEGNIRYDPDSQEVAGPITIAYTLQKSSERSAPETDKDHSETPGQQRIVVVGDSDFLSNTYAGNGQNIDLGLGIMQWLANNDTLVDIGSIRAPDTQLQVSSGGAIALLVVFMMVLPFGLLATGGIIWLRRRRR